MKHKVSLFFSVALLAACSNESTKLKGEFVAGCVQSGGNRGVCSCMFDDLQEKYGFNSAEEVERYIYQFGNEYFEEMAKSALACRDR